MDIETANSNIHELNKHPDGIFNVGEDQKLQRISSWDVFGRIIRWCHNLDGSITQKVNQTISDAFEELKNKPEVIREFNLEKVLIKLENRPSLKIVELREKIFPNHQRSEYILILEYLLRNQLITPKMYDQKMKNQDFSKLPQFRKMMNDDKEVKKQQRGLDNQQALSLQKKAEQNALSLALTKFKIKTKTETNPDTFLKDHIEKHLKQNQEDIEKSRPPLIRKLYLDFKQKYPASELKQEDLETIALDAYIDIALKDFQREMKLSKGELDPLVLMTPLLKSAINMDFKYIMLKPDQINKKINAAINKVNDVRIKIITQKQIDDYIYYDAKDLINNSLLNKSGPPLEKSMNFGLHLIDLKKRLENSIYFIDLKKKVAENPDSIELKEELEDSYSFKLLKKLELIEPNSKATQELLKNSAMTALSDKFIKSLETSLFPEAVDEENRFHLDQLHGEVDDVIKENVSILKMELIKNFPSMDKKILASKAQQTFEEFAPYLLHKAMMKVDPNLQLKPLPKKKSETI